MFQRPIDPFSDNSGGNLLYDVNKLVKIANTHKHTYINCMIAGLLSSLKERTHLSKTSTYLS